MSDIRNDEYNNAALRLNLRYLNNGHTDQSGIYVDPLGWGLWIGRYCEHRFAGADHETAIRLVENEICQTEGKPLPFPPAPIEPTPTTTTWPRFGASYYTSLTDPRCDPVEFAVRLRDAGCNLTRVWLIDAWARGPQYGTGCYDGFLPWQRMPDGKWDLWLHNPSYMDRLRAYVDAMNANGILPLLSGWELYAWSDRKQGMLWVPSATAGPFQFNRQGLHYSDDSAFDRIAQPSGEDGFLSAFYAACVRTLSGLAYDVEIANEMPEKPMHQRMRDSWRTAGFTGAISVNRNEDTPGQYANMRIGTEYDRISYHGKGEIGYLDDVHADEPVYQTFRSFYASRPNFPRIVLSSDGCRKSTDVDDAYDYDALGVVAKDILKRGGSAEHQSRIKLRGFTENRIDLNDLETDWLLSLQK